MIQRNVSERRPFVTSRSGSSPRIFRIRGFARRTSQRRDLIGFQAFARLASSAHGIGLVGRGATPQMAEAHGGRGGVGIRVLLPCVAALPPVMHTPVYVLMSGYGHVKIVLDLGQRPAIYFFGLSFRAVPGSDVEGVDIARVVEVHELLQALDVAVVEELLLKVRPRSLGRGALRRSHGHVARRRRLHLAIRSWRKWCPIVIRAWPRAGTASQESS